MKTGIKNNFYKKSFIIFIVLIILICITVIHGINKSYAPINNKLELNNSTIMNEKKLKIEFYSFGGNSNPKIEAYKIFVDGVNAGALTTESGQITSIYLTEQRELEAQIRDEFNKQVH
jgi:hypothetical protein